MGRTKLRGIEVAGVKLAIEVPDNLPWRWPDDETAGLAQLPLDPDVHIGVRVARPERPSGEVFRYESRAARFEIGWDGEDWLVSIEGAGGSERSARFDADFRHGEILIAPETAVCAAYPLAHPLDELILLHRLIREGCVVVNASVSLRGREALVFLEPPALGGRASQHGLASATRAGYLVLRPVLEFDPSCDTKVWVHSTPWQRDVHPPRFERAPLGGIHVLDPEGKMPLEVLSVEAAENEILQHVFAPIHDPQAASRVFEIVGQVVRRTNVVRMGKTKLDRKISFNWDLPQAGLGFAPPGL